MCHGIRALKAHAVSQRICNIVCLEARQQGGCHPVCCAHLPHLWASQSLTPHPRTRTTTHSSPIVSVMRHATIQARSTTTATRTMLPRPRGNWQPRRGRLVTGATLCAIVAVASPPTRCADSSCASQHDPCVCATVCATVCHRLRVASVRARTSLHPRTSCGRTQSRSRPLRPGAGP